MPHVNEVPPQNNLVPPEVPQIPEVNQGVPWNPEVLPTPVALKLDIAKQVSAGSSLLTFVADCISRAIRAEYWTNQDEETRAHIFRAKKEERAMLKQSQSKQNQDFHSKGQTSNYDHNSKQFGSNKRNGNVYNQGEQRNYPKKKNNQANGGNIYPICAKCENKHLGVCLIRSNTYYLCDKECHYAINCTLNNQNQNQQRQNKNPNSQLHAVQAKFEGSKIAQGRLEAPEPQARIYAYTKGDDEIGTSHVVTGQISIITHSVITLFDSGASHSFISLEFAQKLGKEGVRWLYPSKPPFYQEKFFCLVIGYEMFQ
ncbi:hypothetical protein TIFTF001_016964 [Ficus carica]|uniref:Uncharacterized protein n=1 Tax=Ficus carica TaxID=3494 RepID=A0AA88AKE9_FICCA|nr:hypothetical protein TIFTF001_016964 [Ficus carica]